MGHGILSGSPFHMIGSWTTDMSVDYAELHRWEREEGRGPSKRKSNFKRRSAKKEQLRTKSPGKSQKVIRTFYDFEANHFQRPAGYTPLSPTKSLGIINSPNFDVLTLNLKVFCTGYGLGTYVRTKGEYDTLRFQNVRQKLKLYEIKELFRTGIVIFLRPKMRNSNESSNQKVPLNSAIVLNTTSVTNIKKKRSRIFKKIPWVELPHILDNLQSGQLVINRQLKIGRIIEVTGEKMVVEFGCNTQQYRVRANFGNQNLKIWGLLNGMIYGSAEREILLEKFDDIQKEIKSLD